LADNGSRFELNKNQFLICGNRTCRKVFGNPNNFLQHMEKKKGTEFIIQILKYFGALLNGRYRMIWM
jgi:hypothetical protein